MKQERLMPTLTDNLMKQTMLVQHIITERLLLRPLELSDAKTIEHLAGDPLISMWTSSFTTPFSHQQSIRWVDNSIIAMNSGQSIILAITVKKMRHLIGVVSLRFSENEIPQLGYWLGTEYQGKGYCTEAVNAVIEYGFERLKLPEIMARCAANNTASKNVMLRCGMQKIEETPSIKIIKKSPVLLISYSKKHPTQSE